MLSESMQYEKSIKDHFEQLATQQDTENDSSLLEPLSMDQYQEEVSELGVDILSESYFIKVFKHIYYNLRVPKGGKLCMVVLPFNPGFKDLSPEEVADDRYFYLLYKDANGKTHNFGHFENKFLDILPEELVDECSIKRGEDNIAKADILECYNNLRGICGLWPLKDIDLDKPPYVDYNKTLIFKK